MEGPLMIYGASALLFFREDLKELLASIYRHLVDKFCFSIEIQRKDSGNDKINYALTKALNDSVMRNASRVTLEGNLNYTTSEGNYSTFYEGNQVYISLQKDLIIIWTYKIHCWDLLVGIAGLPRATRKYHYLASLLQTITAKNIDMLKRYVASVYNSHVGSPITPSSIPINQKGDLPVFFFISNTDKWSQPIVRRARKQKEITLNMQAVLDDIGQFCDSKTCDEYEDHGLPYRRGYLLTGPPGTGKSALIEITASIYNRPVYEVFLHSKNMTNSNLIQLVSSVPPMSIIVIDEIDKQYETMKKNNTSQTDAAGILMAIDGPQRLSYGTIIFIIANDLSKIDEDFKGPLLRKGRIDIEFQLNELFRN